MKGVRETPQLIRTTASALQVHRCVVSTAHHCVVPVSGVFQSQQRKLCGEDDVSAHAMGTRLCWIPKTKSKLARNSLSVFAASLPLPLPL